MRTDKSLGKNTILQIRAHYGNQQNVDNPEVIPETSSVTAPLSIESYAITSRAFASWQIAVVSIILGSIVSGALIAINLYQLGHPTLGAIILFLSPFFLMTPERKGNLSGFWICPVASYFLACSLFQWQYAPFKRGFAEITKPPRRFAPLWYAFACGVAFWGVILAVLMLVALCLDLSQLMKGRQPEDDVPIMTAPALPQSESESDETKE